MKTIAIFLIFFSWSFSNAYSQNLKENPALDEKVRKFLEKKSGSWNDMNVPATDGKLLYDLILKNKYTKALEIGTSTGHSSIWIAWALSKTGGKLITIEIDESRYKQAMANFREAGLLDYIDARLADAHKLVYELSGPFDFVFCDADKDWYTRYFKAVSPKLKIGGCYTAHNISSRGYSLSGTQEFFNYVKSLSNYETTLNSDGGGLSISYKKTD